MPQKRYGVDQIIPMLRRADVELGKGMFVPDHRSSQAALNFAGCHGDRRTSLKLVQFVKPGHDDWVVIVVQGAIPHPIPLPTIKFKKQKSLKSPIFNGLLTSVIRRGFLDKITLTQYPGKQYFWRLGGVR